MELGISGKTALVTGAGRGLGAAICRSLDSAGVRIIACSRSNNDLQRLLGSLTSSDHLYFKADLSTFEGTRKLIVELEHQDLQIDIIINNVGGNLNLTNPLMSSEDFWNVMHFNMSAAIELNSNFIPAMQRRNWGRICHVSSISALENQGPPAYCAAKAALNAYLRSLARFVCPDNVIITGIMPGAVLTEGGYWDEAQRNRPEHVSKYLKDRMAIQRFGTEKEISEAVAFLVSEHASFLVGSILLADGGQGRVFYPQEI